LCRWALRNFQLSSPSTAGVVSLCFGSGTDAVAAMTEGMDCLGIEYDINMYSYACARVHAFLSSELARVNYLANGAATYERLVGFGAESQKASDQQHLVFMEGLKTLYSNTHVALTATIDEDEIEEKAIAWAVFRLYYR
jgi:hypothetical protein